MQTIDHTPGRKLFSLGELLTLGGVVLCILSAPMTWAYDPPPTKDIVGAIFVQRYTGNAFYRSAYDLPLGFLRVGWAVVLAATICGLFLLFTPTPRQRPIYLAAQVAAAAFILAIAVYHFGKFMGIAAAVLGAALLLAGAVTRYGPGGQKTTG